MTWFQVNNDVFENPAMMDLSADDWCLWFHALGYASRNLTDGFVPARVMRSMSPVTDPDATAENLQKLGRFERTEGGWLIVGYLDHQQARADVEERRAKTRERVRRHREKRRGEPSPDNDCNAVTNALVTRPDTDTDIDNSSSSSEEPRAVDNSDDDEVGRIRVEAVALIASRRAGRPDVENPSAYAAAVRRSLAPGGEDAWELDLAMSTNPTATAAELAELVEPVNPTPTAERHSTTCPRCEASNGWIPDTNPPHRCTHRPAPPTTSTESHPEARLRLVEPS